MFRLESKEKRKKSGQEISKEGEEKRENESLKPPGENNKIILQWVVIFIYREQRKLDWRLLIYTDLFKVDSGISSYNLH